ncbi:cytochrome ubiquinol oxidase subunit I, partial [Bifidobacterium favimelis]
VFIWLTFLGSSLSAIWILAANSFMQHPTGFEIDKTTGHVRMTNFMDVLSNPQLWREFPHVFFGAVLTAGMVILGMSAWGLLRDRKQHAAVSPVPGSGSAEVAVEEDGEGAGSKRAFFTKSLRIGAVIAIVGSILVIVAGDLQTRFIIDDQPMKFAATEGIYEDTGDPAPWAVVSLINEGDKTSKGIEIPEMLSLLSYHSTSGSVKGMNTVNKELHEKYDAKFGKDMDYYVPVTTLFWSFRFMAAVGFASLILAALALWFTRRSKDTLWSSNWKLWILGICTYLPFVGNTGGWLITELGRYPWLVYGLQTIADGVSPTANVPSLLFTNIVYFLLFLLMGGVMIFYARRVLHQGPDYRGEGLAPSREMAGNAAQRVVLA